MDIQKLIEFQCRFAENFAKLIVFVTMNGEYRCKIGEVERPKEMQKIYVADGRSKAKVSMHEFNCAGDMMVWKKVNGVWQFLNKTEDYKFAGLYWESLDPLCVWGGRFGDDPATEEIEGWDGNHFQFGTLKALGVISPVDGSAPRTTKT